MKGSKDFRKTVLADLKSDAGRRVTEAAAAGMREPRWERAVSELLERLDRSEEDLAASPKGAPWKVAVARLLRERYLTPKFMDRGAPPHGEGFQRPKRRQ